MSPTDGGTVSGEADLIVDVTDDTGIRSVRFFRDGEWLGTDRSGADGWWWAWDCSHLASGSFEVEAQVEDLAGNETSATITLNVSGTVPPLTLTYTSPTEPSYGQIVADGTWDGQACRVKGLAFLDGELIGSPEFHSNGTWELEIILPAPNPALAGSHTLTIEAQDVFGNRGSTEGPVQIRAFWDVPEDHWAVRQIYALCAAGIVGGYPEGDYKPTAEVTRDQMAVYVARALAGGDESVPDPGCATDPFIDVACDHWARKYIQYCVAAGVVQGYPEGDYKPDLQVDRGQMAVYIARAIAGGDGNVPDPDCPEPVFPDVECDFWATKYVQYIRAAGVTEGYPDGMYHPEHVVTRDQMAAYVARAFGLGM